MPAINIRRGLLFLATVVFVVIVFVHASLVKKTEQRPARYLNHLQIMMSSKTATKAKIVLSQQGVHRPHATVSKCPKIFLCQKMYWTYIK